MSVLESMIAMALIGALMMAFLDRVDGYRETVERTSMEQLAREIGWAMRLRAAELMLTNRNDEIGKLAGANPVEALDMQIAGYAGSGTTAEEAHVSPGRWYFNRETRELVYFPALTSGFVAEAGKRPRVSWRGMSDRQRTHREPTPACQDLHARRLLPDDGPRPCRRARC